MNRRIAVAELISQAFAPFVEVGAPLADGSHTAGDILPDLAGGTPRFYVTRLAECGRFFDVMARHDRVAPSIAAVDGEPWPNTVAPAGIAQPGLADIRVFCGSFDRFIKLGLVAQPAAFAT